MRREFKTPATHRRKNKLHVISMLEGLLSNFYVPGTLTGPALRANSQSNAQNKVKRYFQSNGGPGASPVFIKLKATEP